MEDVTYLWVAETVLRKHRRPLNARELVNYGLEDGLFPSEGLSHTPQKSMQARLSIDILHNPTSPFFRTQRGRFFLHELRLKTQEADGTDSTRIPNVYTAERRSPRPSTEQVLCVPTDIYYKSIDFQGIGLVGRNAPLPFLDSHQVRYLPRTDAEESYEYKQVITYTIIQFQSKILSFRRGLYNRAASFLRGAQCVGFGGHVNQDDRTLFSLDDYGIRENAVREISEELRIEGQRPSVAPSKLEYLGIINDDSSDVGLRHFAVVFRYWVDDWALWRNVAKGEASINKLRWIDTRETIPLVEFEYWSQLVIREFFPSTLSAVPSYKIQRRSPFRSKHILCIVGAIGSGKSVTSKFFDSRLNYQSINSGEVLASLLGLQPVPQTPRAVFQAAAERFIESEGGPERLGTALAQAAAQAMGDRVLIDGIRHPETLMALRHAANCPVAVLYVYTPPDVALEMYKAREGYGDANTTPGEFIALRNAPVERKINYIIGDSDVVAFNWIGRAEYTHVLERLAKDIFDE